MNRSRKMLAAGLGAMTPAFIAVNQVQARTAEDIAQTGAPAVALDQEALKSALLELSPAEKLRLAGDRIRLAKSNAPSRQKGVGGTMCVTTCCILTKNCGGAGRPPRQAR